MKEKEVRTKKDRILIGIIGELHGRRIFKVRHSKKTDYIDVEDFIKELQTP